MHPRLAPRGDSTNFRIDKGQEDYDQNAYAIDIFRIGFASGWRGSAQDNPLEIVATTTQAADIANILPQDVEGITITPLMGAGVDPHLYQLTESDNATMNTADKVIYSGLHLEGQFDAVAEALSEQGVPSITLSSLTWERAHQADDTVNWISPAKLEEAITLVQEIVMQMDKYSPAWYRA